jgi:hypothetical protein
MLLFESRMHAIRQAGSVPMATPIDTSHHMIEPQRRGYHVLYRKDQVNYCPGCGRSQWIIGRVCAECCFCTTALPLCQGILRDPLGIVRRSPPIQPAAKAA